MYARKQCRQTKRVVSVCTKRTRSCNAFSDSTTCLLLILNYLFGYLCLPPLISTRSIYPHSFIESKIMSIYTKLDIPSGFLFKRLYVLKSAPVNCVLNLRTMSSHLSFSSILSLSPPIQRSVSPQDAHPPRPLSSQTPHYLFHFPLHSHLPPRESPSP